MSKKMVTAVDAKHKILNATLEVIKTKGMRAVRHRAVAAEAGVSLGSTTYHFKSIEDLISSAFIYWHEQVDVAQNPHFMSLKHDVYTLSNQEVSVKELAEQLAKDGEQFLRDQIFDNSDDRRIELSFHNEALRSEKLRELMIRSWKQEVERVRILFETIGSEFPLEDAEIMFALVLQLEKKAMLIQDKEELEIEFKKMSLILKRHIYLVLGISQTTES